MPAKQGSLELGFEFRQWGDSTDWQAVIPEGMMKLRERSSKHFKLCLGIFKSFLLETRTLQRETDRQRQRVRDKERQRQREIIHQLMC